MVLTPTSWAHNQDHPRPDTANLMSALTKSAFGTVALITAFVLITPSVTWAHDASKLRKKNAKITCESLSQTEPSKIDQSNPHVVQMLKFCEAKRRLREVRNKQRQTDQSFNGQSSGAPNAVIELNPERGSYATVVTPPTLTTDLTLLNSERSSSLTLRGI